MHKINDHKDLDVWKQSMELVTKVYAITSSYPINEQFVIVAQMRRAAIYIPSNIAEGFASQTTKELIQFLYISNGSLSELETQFLISINLKYIDSDPRVEESILRIRKMISKLISTLKKNLRV